MTGGQGSVAGVPSPAELRALAAAAAQLAVQVIQAHARLRGADDEVTRLTGFRLPDLAGELRRAEIGLAATASDLARARAHTGDQVCPAQWGACPDHGNTLRSTGGTSVCAVDGRRWGYDRLAAPCGELVTELVTDPSGSTTPLCHGHALDAIGESGWTSRPLASSTTDITSDDTDPGERS